MDSVERSGLRFGGSKIWASLFFAFLSANIIGPSELLAAAENTD